MTSSDFSVDFLITDLLTSEPMVFAIRKVNCLWNIFPEDKLSSLGLLVEVKLLWDGSGENVTLTM